MLATMLIVIASKKHLLGSPINMYAVISILFPRISDGMILLKHHYINDPSTQEILLNTVTVANLSYDMQVVKF